VYVGVGGLQPSTYCKNSIASKKERRGVEKEEEEVEMEEEKETSLPVRKNLTPPMLRQNCGRPHIARFVSSTT